jgi:hypothetical protein
VDDKESFKMDIFLRFIVIVVIIPLNCFAQPESAVQIQNLVASGDSILKNYPAEKLYLQFDKPYYAVGDTIWFKAYLFHAPTLALSAKSGLLHIDITTDSGKIVKQYLMPVKNGLSWGNMGIDAATFKPGNYSLHAYTNWMRNFGEDIFYTRHFYIAGTGEDTWLVNTKVSASNTIDKVQINNQLQFTDINKRPIANKEFQLSVYAGTKNWYKQLITTNHLGLLDANFSLPQKSANIFIIAELKGDSKKAVIPIQVNRPENADLQFMPEGGDLIAGLPAHIGFKAVGEDGKGTEISGIITDREQKQVATFQSIHNGIGSFDLDVKNEETYTARVNLPEGKRKEYPLPGIKNSGIVLNITNSAEKDSITVSAATTNDIAKSGESYFLFGKSRGVVCYAAVITFAHGKVQKAIATQLFPSGIAHFILTTSKGRPLNERIVFIDNKDNLDIRIVNKNITYSPWDSVALQLNVSDKTGTPVNCNFSIAVTDDDLVKQDTLNNDNILSHLLLAGDLKGYVEEPAYYLQCSNSKNPQALDNLLLTQGWVNYDWPVDKTHPLFNPETEFTVKGYVVNAFNSPVKATRVQLLSWSPLLVTDTLTNNEGVFVFNNFPRIDTPVFQLRAVNKRGKSFNIGIRMDEQAIPAYTLKYPTTGPWYLNADGPLINYSKRQDSIARLKDGFEGTGHRLSEVKIVARKIVKDSQNLNGPGNADLVLNEKDMIKAGKKSWLEIFQENIKGFRISNRWVYEFPYIEERFVIFIVDGSFLEPVDEPTRLYADNVMGFLKSHSAEDIKGIEVNASEQYSMKYNRRFFPVKDFKHYAFIEITTRSGKGPYMGNSTPGTYLYKPLALSWPKQFYKPKYKVNDTTRHLLDFRSTIDWEPNVITDKNGNATVSFYAADKPGTYTLIIEGTDGSGNLGFKMQKIIINKPKPYTKL